MVPHHSTKLARTRASNSARDKQRWLCVHESKLSGGMHPRNSAEKEIAPTAWIAGSRVTPTGLRA